MVIDESHNFRNGGDADKEGKENRYTRLMNKVIRPGARTRVLMLSATPVNSLHVRQAAAAGVESSRDPFHEL